MHLSVTTALLGPALVVSGAVLPQSSSTPLKSLAPPAPIDSFPVTKHKVVQPDELFNALAVKGIEIIKNITDPFASILADLNITDGNNSGSSDDSQINTASTKNSDVKTASVNNKATKAATCSNPRQRTEWDSYSASDKKAYLNAINCLRNKPSAGTYAPSGSRYEDLVKVHQVMTPNIHDNAIFLVWHRYFTWTFEDILRTECGFDRNLPWWNEGRNAGKFAASSVFSGDYYGAIAINGNCVSNGMFANSNLNIGPGDSNSVHCLSRSGNNNYTNLQTEDVVSAVNSWPDYKDMAYYAEGTYHAYGHLGVGAVQADKYASPGDPWFFLHHAYVDRNFAAWQANDNSRTTSIDGTDINGNSLTLDTTIDVGGLRPSVRVRDVMSTIGGNFCYTYSS